MIEIKKEILEQIQRSAIEDPRYIAKIIRRINPEIKKVIQYLANLEIPLQDACTVFCYYCENGLDNFEIKETKTIEEFFEEIEKDNEALADYITICDFSQANKIVTLIALYRIFESELEIRKMEIDET